MMFIQRGNCGPRIHFAHPVSMEMREGRDDVFLETWTWVQDNLDEKTVMGGQEGHTGHTG